MKFNYNDGGRSAAGFKKSKAGDCVTRAVAIASGVPYMQVYDKLSHGNMNQRNSKRASKNHGKPSADHGINTTRKWFKDYMKELGFTWVPCMGIGTGCTVHLVDGELPAGRLVVALSKHLTAVIDGVINDTYSPERNGSWIQVKDGIETRGTSHRCVYGYWILK